MWCRLSQNCSPGGAHTLRALALERAWAGGEAAAALAAHAAHALPPPPLPAALERAAAAAHHLLHQYLQVRAHPFLSLPLSMFTALCTCSPFALRK